MNPEIEQMRAVIDALPDPVFILTESGRYAGVVGGKDSRFYHDGSMLVGHTLHEVLPKDKADWFLVQIRQALDENCLHTVEYGLGGEDVAGLDTERGPAGTLWFEGRIHPLTSKYDGERAVVWVARNITERYALETRLRALSEADDLTGLFNRRKMLQELQDSLRKFTRYKQPTALLMIDIDNFKDINDRFGHLVGDRVLVQVAQACQQQFRDADRLARFGGEEFAAILPHSSLHAAEVVAERLRQSIEQTALQPAAASGGGGVTVSIGISEFQETDDSEEAIIRRADAALYQAKRSGKNRVVIYHQASDQPG